MDDDNIRTPDQVIQEQLLEDNRSDFERELEEAIYLSFKDLEETKQQYKKYEEELMKSYEDETNRRKELFQKFNIELIRISNIDKETKELRNILEPIIEAYCSQSINYCVVDIDTHEKIFKILNTMRCKQVVSVLKEFIQIDT
jgi:hypothetical protein